MSTKASWHATLAALALQVALLCAVPAGAQEATATLTGTVKDQSGAVAPAVVVTLRNEKTNVTAHEEEQRRWELPVHSGSDRNLRADG